MKRAVNLVFAYMVTSIFLWGVSEYIWFNILAYDPEGVFRNINKYTCLYSPDIPRGSVHCAIYTHGIGTRLNSSSFEEKFSDACKIQLQGFSYKTFSVPP